MFNFKFGRFRRRGEVDAGDHVLSTSCLYRGWTLCFTSQDSRRGQSACCEARVRPPRNNPKVSAATTATVNCAADEERGTQNTRL